jgi:neutral amino acid transport system permease protein
MRAVADNKDLAESSGIDVKRVILAVWILGGGLAAMGGVMQGLVVGGVQWDMGFRLLLLMFAGVIVGGIGTAYVAMVGGLLVGVTSEVSTFWFSVDLKLVFAFLILIVVLLFRPQGLLGKKERFG